MLYKNVWEISIFSGIFFVWLFHAFVEFYSCVARRIFGEKKIMLSEILDFVLLCILKTFLNINKLGTFIDLF